MGKLTAIPSDKAFNGKPIRIALLHLAPRYDNVLERV